MPVLYFFMNIEGTIGIFLVLVLHMGRKDHGWKKKKEKKAIEYEKPFKV